MIEFPNRVDELKILKYNLPFASDEILEYCVDFLQNAHVHDEPFTVRDGINIVRYYIKTRDLNNKDKNKLNKKEFKNTIKQVAEKSAIRYCSDEYKKLMKEQQDY